MSSPGYKPLAEYFDFIKDKKAIIVGPAGYLVGMGLGKEIDKYDLIVRLNLSCPVAEVMKKDVGSRTDILYHLLFRKHQLRARPDLFKWHTKDELRSWKADGIKWLIVKLTRNRPEVKKFAPLAENILNWTCVKKSEHSYLRRELKTGANMGTIAMYHLLKGGVKSLHVVGCDFHQTGYYVSYGGFNDKQAKDGIVEKGKMNKIWGQTNAPGSDKLHNVPKQLAYLAKLRNNYSNFTVDDVLGRLIDGVVE